MNWLKMFVISLAKDMLRTMIQAALAKAVADASGEILNSTKLKEEEKDLILQGIALLKMRAAVRLEGVLNKNA